MGKTNAERQRLYRQRRDADPSRREEYLHTEQARYIKLKRLGVRKLISEQSDKDKKITIYKHTGNVEDYTNYRETLSLATTEFKKSKRTLEKNW